MWAIVWKDVRLELRTKERLASFFVLAVLIVLVWIFALGPQQARDPHVGAAVLWVGLLFAGMLSLQRSFLIEQERGCLSGLLLCPIAPSDIFVAKLFGNIVFLSLVQAIVVPITIVLCGLPVSWSLFGLPLIVLLGIIGFSALGTIFAALAVRTRAGEVLFPLVLLPLLVPLLLSAVQTTGALLSGGEWTGVWLRVLIAFDVVFVVAGWLLFGQAVYE